MAKKKYRKKSRNGISKMIIVVTLIIVTVSVLSLFYLDRKENAYIQSIESLPIEAKKELVDASNPSFFQKNITNENLYPYYDRLTSIGRDNVVLQLVLSRWEKKYQKELDESQEYLGTLGLKLTIQEEINDLFIVNEKEFAINGSSINLTLEPKKDITREQLLDINDYLNHTLISGSEHNEWKQNITQIIEKLPKFESDGLR